MGGHKIMVCVMSTSRDGSSHRGSLANTSLQRVRYIATIRHTITPTVMPISVPTHIKTTLDLNIYVRRSVGGVFIHAGVGSRKVRCRDSGFLSIVQINSSFAGGNSFSGSCLESAPP